MEQNQNLKTITDAFTQMCRDALGDNLVGVYLHGSAVMGCFDWRRSDIDIIVVVEHAPDDTVKRRFMDALMPINAAAPSKGIEMNIVLLKYCQTFVYPTPFELHYSNAHHDRYSAAPDEYIAEMKGTDRDLAAHFTIIKSFGEALYGPPVEKVFGDVPDDCFLDSLMYDVGSARTEILESPVYCTLNLCRVLAWRSDGLLTSKRTGGEWGRANLPRPYCDTAAAALTAYNKASPAQAEPETLVAFADYMLTRIEHS